MQSKAAQIITISVWQSAASLRNKSLSLRSNKGQDMSKRLNKTHIKTQSSRALNARSSIAISMFLNTANLVAICGSQRNRTHFTKILMKSCVCRRKLPVAFLTSLKTRLKELFSSCRTPKLTFCKRRQSMRTKWCESAKTRPSQTVSQLPKPNRKLPPTAQPLQPRSLYLKGPVFTETWSQVGQMNFRTTRCRWVEWARHSQGSQVLISS